MKEYERKQLLARVDREGATVGVSIPERVDVQGEPVDLREFVMEISRRDTIPPGERERVERAKRNLRRERTERLERLEEDDISWAEGETLADVIVGIDRALNALESLGSTDIEGERERKETADQKRWVSFLKQALGRDEQDARGGVGR